MSIQNAYEKVVAQLKAGFAGGRETTVGASEIGACARMVSYRKHGTPVDEGYTDTGGFAFRGDVMEDNALVPVVRAWVEASGGDLKWAGQNDQMRIMDEARGASATPDGLAVNIPLAFLADLGVADITNGSGLEEETCVYVELKSIDPRVADHNLPKPNHVDQCNYGLGLVRDTEFEEEVFVKNKKTGKTKSKFVTKHYKPHYAVLVYMDASDYSKISTFVVKFDPPGFKSQLERAKWIMKTDPEMVRPEGKIGGGKDCRYCEFSQRCIGYAAMVPQKDNKAPKPVVTKIRTLAGMLKEAKAHVETWSGRCREIEAEIKETLATAGTRFVTTDIAKVAWSSVKGRATYSSPKMQAALKKLGVDVEQFKSVGNSSERLSVEFISSDA